MCGLFAIINTDKSSAKKELLSKALAALKHRGPDFSNSWVKEHIALGHQRLSIFDVTEKAHQPLIYKSLRIIFNGAIYNYIELREELEINGYQFSSRSDTEVICAAYLKWGSKCLNHFNGMWSFVIFDERDDSIFVSRDRFGIKPLYYLKSDLAYYFSSEQKAILEIPDYSIKLNYDLAKRFLQSGKTHYKDNTFFLGIKSFPAGSYGVLLNGTFTISKYYNIGEQVGKPSKKVKYGSAKEKFKTLLTDAVKIRTRADVPIGFSQSGGVDSSSVVGIAKRVLQDQDLNSYSVCFDDYSEEEKMINIANMDFGAKNHKTRPPLKGLIDKLYTVSWQQEIPIASASVLAQNYLYDLVSQFDSKVILGGQGADEICYGYDAFIKLKLKSNPLMFFEAPIFYTQLILKYIKREKTQLNILHGVEEKNDDLNNQKHLAINMLNVDPLPALLHFEDRNAMHYGIESRLPFLDYRLVEFCLNCPPQFFNKGPNRKKLLKDSMSNIVPRAILKRKKKNAFAAPQDRWLQENEKEVIELLESKYKLLEAFLGRDKSVLQRATKTMRWRLLNLLVFRDRFGV